MNDAYSSTVKLQLQDVDYVASTVRELSKAAARPTNSWRCSRNITNMQWLDFQLVADAILQKFVITIWMHWQRIRFCEDLTGHMVYHNKVFAYIISMTFL